MENQVEEIKSKLDIVEVINRYLPLKKRGRHHIACCPFHQEKTPSFTVSSELQIFKCFGCGKAGDVFTFIQEYDRVTFPESLETLAKLAGVVLVKSPNFSAEDRRRAQLLAINLEVSRYYHYLLTSHPIGKPALDYVLGRGITPATIKLFRLGFSPQNSASLVNHLTKKGFSIGDIIATGTIGQSNYNNSYYDRFQTRLIFPLIDYRDRIVGFSGRSIPGLTRADSAKYINSPETEIYHKSQTVFGLNLTKEAIKKANKVIVVEGEFDLISPFQSGHQNIVAIKGTAFTQDQLELLRRYTTSLVLGLDSDFAGNHAALRSIQLADSLGFDLEVLTLGDKFKDPDEAVRADPVFFASCLEKTIPVWDFVIASAVKNYNIDTVAGKTKAIAEVLPYLSKISNEVIRSDYLKKFADQIGSSEVAVTAEARKYNTGMVPTSSRDNIPAPPQSSQLSERLEEAILVLIFGARNPQKLSQKHSLRLKTFATPRFQVIINQILATHSFSASDFQSELPPEIRPIFESIYLEATSSEVAPQSRLHKLKNLFAKLEIYHLKNQLKTIATSFRDGDPSFSPAQEIISRLNRLQAKDP
ncbi:MAG: DNA primase [Candidatus Shapirobacteria bacterium]